MWNNQIETIYRKAFQVPLHPHPALEVNSRTIDSVESNCADYTESSVVIKVNGETVFCAVIQKD